MLETYDQLAEFYDLEYDHKDDDIPFYFDIADKYGSPILEIGAGTGRLALPLAENGFQVLGIEYSAKMLQQARQKIDELPEKYKKNITLVKGDMRSFSLDQQFPVSIIPFRGFLHNLNMKDQLDTLKCIHKHLRPNGILALDLFVPVYSVMAQTKWQDEISAEELDDAVSGVSLSTNVAHEPDKQLLTIKNIYNKKNMQVVGQYKYRYIFRYEMELLLRLAGFDILSVHGGFQKEPYDFYSGVMVFIAKKNSH